MKKIVSFFILLIILLSTGVFLIPSAWAEEDQTCTNINDSVEKSKCLNDLINKYQAQLNEARGQAKTLKSQLTYIDTQNKVAQLKITEAENQIAKLDHEINDLATRITRLSATLDDLSRVLLNRIVQTYKYGNYSTVDLFFSSNGFADLLQKVKYVSVAQANDKKVLYQLQATKITYNDQKVDKESRQTQQEKLRKDLEKYQGQLADQQKSKQELLRITQNDEATYQKLIAQAQAQLAAFASFTDSRGASLLNNQTVCDDWGCYYNQRDSQWGTLLINRDTSCNGPCNTARVGCLITSLSMVASHLGRKDILPSDIALSDSGNFSVGTASLNKGTINVKGINITRRTIAGSLNPDLVKDGPIIVGVRYGPFGTHFVVVKSYTNNNYIMNDPYLEGGRDKIFTDSYSLNSVFEVDKVSI